MSEIFEALDQLPPDPILGVTAAFRADNSPLKVDLGVGVYRDDSGRTPIFDAVRQAEAALVAEQQTKAYVGPAGNQEFNEHITALALGPVARQQRERLAVIQTVGGCGALRVGAELIRAARPEAVVHVSDPTWANHQPLLGSSGLALEAYPYYDARSRGVDFERMVERLSKLPARSVVLIHACCHNPTGADLSPEHWGVLAELLPARGLVPFVDLAYQGFGEDLAADVAGLRLLADRVPELLLAVSCSKNFGMYRERTGALAVLAANRSSAAAVASHQARTARRMYSMPPDHGAAVVARVLGDPGPAAGMGRGPRGHGGADEVAALDAGRKARGGVTGEGFFLAGATGGHVLAARARPGCDRPPQGRAPRLRAARRAHERGRPQRNQRGLRGGEHRRADGLSR